MLSFSLIYWELTAIFAPELITVDLFELILSRGCAYTALFIAPNGYTRLSRPKPSRYGLGEIPIKIAKVHAAL